MYKSSSEVSYVIDSNNIESLDANVNTGIDENILKSSVFLVIENPAKTSIKTCSAVLLRKKDTTSEKMVVMTNRHCFESSDLANQSISSATCDYTKVYLNPSMKYKPLPSYNCMPGSLVVSANLDIAAFQIAAGIEDSYLTGVGLPILPNFIPGKDAVVVHYPKIEGQTYLLEKEGFEVPSPAITQGDCKVYGNFAENLWKSDPQLKYSLSHSCDMTFGSSGSALIDIENAAVIGINWGGIELSNGSETFHKNAAIKAINLVNFLEKNFGATYFQVLNREVKPTPGRVSRSNNMTETRATCAVLDGLRGKGSSTPLPLVIVLLIPTLFVFRLRR